MPLMECTFRVLQGLVGWKRQGLTDSLVNKPKNPCILFFLVAKWNTTDWVTTTTDIYFFIVLECRSTATGCHRFGFWWDLSPRLVVDHFLIMFLLGIFFVLLCREFFGVLFSSYKDTNSIRLGSYLHKLT